MIWNVKLAAFSDVTTSPTNSRVTDWRSKALPRPLDHLSRVADSTRVRGCFALWQRTRHILAPAFDYHMRAELVTNALDMLAFEVSQAIFHSDQGKQYGAEVTRLLLLQKGFELSMSRAGKDAFLQKLRRSVLYEQELQANVYFIHDFQLVPLAEFFPWMRPPIWFCHVDTAHTNPSAQQYIQQFLDPYAIACFNSQASVFKDLLPEKAQVVTLGIDPFRVKNRPLPRERGMEILARCGIDTTRPLITQVSRFGIWKNPWQVIDIYRQVKQQMPTVQLAMIGALEAKDDITAEVILTDLQRHYVHGDPDIYLLSDPTIIDHEVVNAFQRYSSVVLQRSIREGFGFTFTEAMWKKQPVIGTCVTGLQLQISHGYNGYVVDDTETAAAYTLKFLGDRDPWRELGENAYDTVRQRFLFPTMILGYLQVLARAQTNARALVKPGMALIETTGAGVELAA
jgi:trehalose synthase